MEAFLTFIGDHPILTLGIVAILAIAVLAHLSERMDRKYGDE